MPQDSNQSQPPLYFDCHMCGECCSSWNIPIETHKAQRLLEKPWVQARLAETHRQLAPMTAETYRIPLTDENVCVFLAEDRRCMVETQEGLALKPHECQRFPFATVRLPDGSDWHETSAACKSISEKLLLAFQPIQPRPPLPAFPPASQLPSQRFRKHVEASQNPDSEPPIDDPDLWAAQARLQVSLEPVALLPERLPFKGFRSMSLAQYAAYQQALPAIFQAETHPETALRQANEALHGFAAPTGKRRAKTLGPASENASDSGEGHADLYVAEGFLFKRLRGKRSPGKSVLDKTALGKFVSWVITVGFLRKPYRTLSALQLLGGQSYTDPRIFGQPISLRKQAKLPWNPELNLHLNAFLFNLLQRKRLLALGSSLAAHLAMAGVACLLVQWYAQTLAGLAGCDTIGEKELATAIRLVERYYTGHQPRFLNWFSSRWRGELIHGLLFGALWGR